jgi:hypothetical protein
MHDLIFPRPWRIRAACELANERYATLTQAWSSGGVAPSPFSTTAAPLDRWTLATLYLSGVRFLWLASTLTGSELLERLLVFNQRRGLSSRSLDALNKAMRIGSHK